jgi:hypothetical protein
MYGHIAKDCDNICPLCYNLHNSTVCIHSLIEFSRKVTKIIKNNVVKDPEEIRRTIKETKEKIQLENAKKAIDKYYELQIKPTCSFQFILEKHELQSNKENKEKVIENNGLIYEDVDDEFEQESKGEVNTVYEDNSDEEIIENDEEVTERQETLKEKYERWAKFEDESETENKPVIKMNTEIPEWRKCQKQYIGNEASKPVLRITHGNDITVNFRKNPDIIPLAVLKMQIYLEDQKKELRKTQKYISDFKYFNQVKNDIKNMEKQQEKLADEIKKMKEWKKEKKDQFYQNLNKKREEFYKKKAQQYKRMKEKYRMYKKKREEFYQNKKIWEKLKKNKGFKIFVDFRSRKPKTNNEEKEDYNNYNDNWWDYS